MRKPYHPLMKNPLIVPMVARQKVLSMVHNSSLTRHFGRDFTLQTIRARMDWLGVGRNVNNVCSSCPIYQKAGPASTAKALLHPLQVIKEPFICIAMDIAGPLRITKKGSSYILVIMDFATKWPEAFPFIM